MDFNNNVDLLKFLHENGFDNLDLSRNKENLNCSLPDILEFPNFMRKKAISYTIICFLLSLYMFIILAIVCDEYLVPAVERLCYSLHMPYDIAGATFLALATSAPELFINFVGTFVTEGDIGIGTIVGSSVFNTLAIPAVCGILTSTSSQLDWWPITRDIIWYLLAVVVLVLLLFDGVIHLYECLFLLLAYVIYLITLILDRKIQRCCRNLDNREDSIMTDDPMEREESPLQSFRNHICSWPSEGSVWVKIWWVITYPTVFVLAITIPSVRCFYFGTMLLAVVWISIISYTVTWFLTIVGYNIGIPDSIMGLTILAAGTSVPEAVSSYIVTRKGYGAMAMSNAIASNTVDILVCLGFPWSLKILILRRAVVINSTGLYITGLMLIITSLILYCAFLLTKFVLGKTVGWLSLITYIIFLIFTCGVEMYFLRPICDIESDIHSYFVKAAT